MLVRARFFFALEPPWDWVASLEQVQRQLQRRGLEQLGWIDWELLHLTLTPLSRAEPRSVAQIIATMRAAAAGCDPFVLQLGAMALFGRSRAPTVLWSGVRGETDQLQRLWAALQDSARALGCSVGQTQFTPHITLARIPLQLREDIAPRLGSALAQTTVPAADSYLVRRISFIRSVTEFDRVRYERLATAVVGGEERGC